MKFVWTPKQRGFYSRWLEVRWLSESGFVLTIFGRNYGG